MLFVINFLYVLVISNILRKLISEWCWSHELFSWVAKRRFVLDWLGVSITVAEYFKRGESVTHGRLSSKRHQWGYQSTCHCNVSNRLSKVICRRSLLQPPAWGLVLIWGSLLAKAEKETYQSFFFDCMVLFSGWLTQQIPSNQSFIPW